MADFFSKRKTGMPLLIYAERVHTAKWRKHLKADTKQRNWPNLSGSD